MTSGVDAAPIWHPSPNFGARRDGLLPELIVLHHTAMLSANAALDRLCDPDAEVSAHYLIARDGQVFQLVEESQRSWHAGAGEWAGAGDVNSRSVGIEIDNAGPARDNPPFSAPAMAALEGLLPGIMTRWTIPPTGVIAHSDMAPGRKSDPGAKFDWPRLARAGLAVWPKAVPGPPPDPAAFDALAIACGYPVGVDHPTRLAAFRLRFRPAATGALTQADMDAAAGLCTAMGVDANPPRA